MASLRWPSMARRRHWKCIRGISNESDMIGRVSVLVARRGDDSADVFDVDATKNFVGCLLGFWVGGARNIKVAWEGIGLRPDIRGLWTSSKLIECSSILYVTIKLT